MTKFLRGLAAPIMALLAISFAVPAYAQVVHIAGSDGSTYREAGVDTTGALKIAGAQGATFGSGSLAPTAAYTAVGGTDGTNGRILSVTSSGALNTTGTWTATAASASATGGVRVIGTDGTTDRTLLTNAAGQLQITATGNVGSGATDSGNPVKVGGVYTTTNPTVTTGQRVDWQMTARGTGEVTVCDQNTATSGSNCAGVTSGGDGLANGSAGVITYDRPSTYNGSSWDRQLGRNAGASSGGLGTLAVGLNADSVSNGMTNFHLISAATTNATSVKASNAKLYGGLVCNSNAAVRYLKIYNKASAPTVGTDVPVISILVPVNNCVNLASVFSDYGLWLTTGFALATTVNIADSDATAVTNGDLSINISYL